MNYQPKISIIMPLYNVAIEYFMGALFSIFNQTYTNWELCIADASDKKLTNLMNKKDKIKTIIIENKGIAWNTNKALELATGEYVAFLDHDDLLTVNALEEVVIALNKNNELDIIYSDEDKVSGLTIKDPFYKPDWAPDMLRSYNYICHLSVYKKSFINELGGLREGFDGAQDYDLILRATEKTTKIHHIPKVLYHWRMSSNSTAQNPDSKPYTDISAKKALTEHIERLGWKGTVSNGLFKNSFKIEYELKEKPKVSIIICNKDKTELLNKCITSILTKTAYSNYDIIIVENNSVESKTFKYYEDIKSDRIKVITWNNPFNYPAINNFGVENTDSEYILLLNNDVEVINSDWLDRMVEYIIREDVGIVGAKLYFPNNTIQHAGVIINDTRMPIHVGATGSRNDLGYMGRLKIVQNMMCVTGACLLTKKSVFNKVGKLDPLWALAFNDVDYCFKVFQAGFRIVWTPYAELYHHESQTRGYEDTPEKKKRFLGEIRHLVHKWNLLLSNGDVMYRLTKGRFT